VVDSQEKLEALLRNLREASWIAVDTEADSLHAYPEKVCLIQISTETGDSLVDPLARIDLDPLLEALSAHELIMHGADYDLRLFRKHHEFVPRAIFDTMLAARLLGHHQFGLSHLVEVFLGVKLEKGPQKANWAMRPLTERMERYARNDTRHLKPLADRLRAALEAGGRLAWHQESCSRLIAECTKPKPLDGESVWRVKGSHHLCRPALAVLRELWHWRESEALAANKPPFFILSHDNLVAIAAAAVKAHSVEKLLPRHLSERRRGTLLRAVARGLEALPENHPKFLRSKSRRPADGEKRRFTELQKRRDTLAAELGIDPTVIASRGTLSDLAHDWPKYSEELMSWQRRLLES
jgi:ribonuclease D